MTIKDLKERMTEIDYVYVALPRQEVVAEFTDIEVANAYAKSFNGVVYKHFPYQEYGFEDPYEFTNTWTVVDAEGDIIEYQVNDSNQVEEVVVG